MTGPAEPEQAREACACGAYLSECTGCGLDICPRCDDDCDGDGSAP